MGCALLAMRATSPLHGKCSVRYGMYQPSGVRVISRWRSEPDCDKDLEDGSGGKKGMGREVGPDGVTRRDLNAGKRARLERWAGVGRTQAMMESVRGRGSGRSGGRENGVESVFTSHHEVQVRLGHVAEAAVKDDGERNVVERRVVGGGVAGADATWRLPRSSSS